MTRFRNLLVVPLLSALLGKGMAAQFLDDFSTDTSSNYTLTDTSGTGGSFEISGGTLNVTNAPSNTTNVFHNTAQLEAGEYVRVTVPVGTAYNFQLTVSTTTRSPNTGTEDGIRWNVWRTANMWSRTYRDGALAGADSKTYAGVSGWTGNLDLLIYRDTNTVYRLAYDVGNGPLVVDTITLAETAAVSGMFVGVEGFSPASPTTPTTRNFDNLEILPIEVAAPAITSFTYNPGDGSATAALKGAPGTAYKLVEADDLDFGNPDQDPIPLVMATLGTLQNGGNEVVTDSNGEAAVEFNLGTSKPATFLRVEQP
jgi:hypothetical protein